MYKRQILGSILEKIEQALKDMLIGWIESNLTNMFTDVNEKVGTIAAEVGQTPSGWNGGVYQMIRGPVSYTHLDVYKRQGLVGTILKLAAISKSFSPNTMYAISPSRTAWTA